MTMRDRLSACASSVLDPLDEPDLRPVAHALLVTLLEVWSWPLCEGDVTARKMRDLAEQTIRTLPCPPDAGRL